MSGGWLASLRRLRVISMRESAEVEAVVRRIWDSALKGDFDTFRDRFSRNPGLRVIAAAEDEWWRGYDLAVGLWQTRIGEVGPVRVEYHRMEAFESDGVGWAAGEVTFITRSGDRFPLRFTCVVELEAGTWRVVQWHASRGVSNTDQWGFELTNTLESLIDSLDASSQQTLAGVSPSGTVTIMFTDIEDSTRLSRELGDEIWAERMQTHFAVVRRIVEEYGGTLVKTLGDGTMAGFPGATGALSAAVHLQQELIGSDWKVRIGLHTGEVRHLAGDYVGLAVSKAARVASAAAASEILVSSITAELVTGPDVTFGDERTATLKGLTGSHRLIPIQWHTVD